MMEGLWGLWLGLIETGMALAIFFVLVKRGWPGEDDDCIARDDCHCERIRSGGIKQPSNTWSNLAFVLVGMLILISAGGSRAVSGNPIATVPFYPISYGLLVISLGLGSMFFHASMKKWGSIVDNLAMYWFLSFVVLYDIYRILDARNLGMFILIFLFLNVALAAVRFLNEGSERYVFPVLFLWLIIIEILISTGAFGDIGLAREFLPWLVLEVVTFAVAFGIWLLSGTGKPLCRPDSWIQGHAVWQILGALAAGFLYLNLLAESLS